VNLEDGNAALVITEFYGFHRGRCLGTAKIFFWFGRPGYRAEIMDIGVQIAPGKPRIYVPFHQILYECFAIGIRKGLDEVEIARVLNIYLVLPVFVPFEKRNNTRR